MSANAGLNWDPYDQQHFKNPHPVLARLRDEAPVYYNEEYDFFAVSRYADVERMLGDWETFSSARGDILEMIKANIPVPAGSFIHQDPPDHTAYRKALTRVFTPRRVAILEPQIRAFCAQSLDPLVEGGEFDFIANLGAEMPMRVISMLLGIPEEDQVAIRERVDANLRVEAGKPIDYSQTRSIGEGFEGYIDWRMENPSDDLMTELLNMEFDDATGTKRKFTREEVLVITNILAGAGNETTNRLIGWTGKILAEHPDQRRQIVENRALVAPAIEEILRYEPPGPSVARYVMKDTEFHGVKVPAGSVILGLIAAANRDERKFPDGERFDIHRERLPHLTFGYGFHNCIGNALARIEGRIALDELLNRFPDWDVDLENGRLSSTSTVRGWETLPAHTPEAKSRGLKAKPAAPADAGPPPAPAGAETWAVTLQTPAGPQDMTVHIVREAGGFGGRVDSPMGSEPIKNGKATGSALSWTMDVKKPMALKLTFEVETEDGVMTGHAKLGVFGKAELKGKRVAH